MLVETSRYIAWDTSSTTGVLSAIEVNADGFRLICEWTLNLEVANHSERLLWAVDNMLQVAGWKPEEITAIGVGVGPGSFTGLRIGITTARMMAMQLSIPILPLPSLMLFAMAARESLGELNRSESVQIIACSDAAKGEWFVLMTDAARLDQDWNEATTQKPEAVLLEITLRETQKKLNETNRWTAVGPSVVRYESMFATLNQQTRIQTENPLIHVPSPRMLACLLYQAILKKIELPFDQILPNYLRASEAEIKLAQGLLKKSPTSTGAK